MKTNQNYFDRFRANIIGIDKTFISPFGEKKIVYADWIASGRLYKPVEETILNKFAPLVGNTHSESSVTGTSMTMAYKEAKDIIKKHVNANEKDVLLFAGFGMTAAVNKFQRILGLKVSEQLQKFTNIPTEERPVVFLTHMEHHSNHTSWLETICDVIVIEPDDSGLINIEHFEQLLKQYKTVL
jgi:selenocysteine lyase/cysteine desulfurase